MCLKACGILVNVTIRCAHTLTMKVSLFWQPPAEIKFMKWNSINE